MRSIRSFFGGLVDWDAVLREFESGSLAGRWGWLEVLRQGRDGAWVGTFVPAEVCVDVTRLPPSLLVPVLCMDGRCGPAFPQYYGRLQTEGGRLHVYLEGGLGRPSRRMEQRAVAQLGEWYTMTGGWYGSPLSLSSSQRVYHFWIEGHIRPNWSQLSEVERQVVIANVVGALSPIADYVLKDTLVGPIAVEVYGVWLDQASFLRSFSELLGGLPITYERFLDIVGIVPFLGSGPDALSALSAIFDLRPRFTP